MSERRSGMGRVDLLWENGRVFDAFSGTFRRTDLAVRDGRVVGFGAASAQERVDLAGRWVVPGFIDAHVHLESSQLSPAEFARVVLPHGTTTVIADPHEIANVLGLDGIRYLIEATRPLPLRVHLMAPSCVPASPFETAGAEIGRTEIERVLEWERVLGLGEVMNYPGVIAGDAEVGGKLAAAAGRPIDGHAPGLEKAALWAYVLAGPRTDHESTSLAEAREKLAAGMHVLIREGSTARNLDALLPLLTERSAPFVHFCTDDRHPRTLIEEGHIDGSIRRAIEAGVAPETALAAATIHAARAYGLSDLGALAPGYRADAVILSDLRSLRIDAVFAGGREAAVNGVCVADLPSVASDRARGTVRVDLDRVSFRLPVPNGMARPRVRAIRVVPGQVVTGEEQVDAEVLGGAAVAAPERDLLKLAVVERHGRAGTVGIGFVRGFGLQRGAIASSVAHDSHNIVVVGADDDAMRRAVRAVVAADGGQVVVDGDDVAVLPLPIAGLISDRPAAELVATEARLEAAARCLGSRLPSPFMALSFLALPVIPALKLTDRGLVDVGAFRIVSAFVGEEEALGPDGR